MDTSIWQSGRYDRHGTALDLGGLSCSPPGWCCAPGRPATLAAIAEIMRDPRMSDYLPLPRPYTARRCPGVRPAGSRRATAADREPTGTRHRSGRLRAVVRDGRLVAAIGMDLPPGGRPAAPRDRVLGGQRSTGAAATPPRQSRERWREFGFSTACTASRSAATSPTPPRPGGAAGRLQLRGHRSGVQPRSQHGDADHAVFARLADDSGAQVPPALPRLTRAHRRDGRPAQARPGRLADAVRRGRQRRIPAVGLRRATTAEQTAIRRAAARRAVLAGRPRAPTC